MKANTGAENATEISYFSVRHHRLTDFLAVQEKRSRTLVDSMVAY